MRRGSGPGAAVPGAGSGGKGGLLCIVKLLDGSSLQLEVNKKAPALSTYEQVLRQLSILEKEFFAFQYEDEQKNMQWVDLQKPLKKQIKKLPMKVNFRVKYYPLDPMVPHASCRNHFYQQLRKDIIDGTLKCPNQAVPSVLSYILQADLGDYESVENDVEHIVDNGLLLQECTDLQEEVASFHRLYKGMNVLDAVAGFLRKVRDLETYGIQLYGTRYEDTPCEMGITPGGISVFRRNRRIVFHDWEVVAEVSFKNKKLLIVLISPGNSDTTVTLEMDSLKVCKDVWKICADFASFYSEPGRRVREEPETLRSPGAQGSPEKFSYPPPQSSPQRSPQRSPSKQHSASSLDHTTAQQKTKSLPHKLPSHDPITAALIAHGSPDGIAPDTPTTPGDFTSLSNSNSDQNLSPLTPSSLGGGVGGGVNPDSAMDLILPGIPNLRDEDGLPLKHPSQQQTTPPQIKTTPPLKQQQVDNDQPYRYKSYKDHIKDTSPVLPRGHGQEKLELSHVPENGHFVRQDVGAPMMEQASDGLNGDLQPPSLPPRNYRSQYRSEFHSKGSNNPQQQQQQQGGLQHVSPPSPLSGQDSCGSNSQANLSQDMDGSLLDLADELGGGASTSSVHSGSSRRGHTLGRGGYHSPGKYSPQNGYNSQTLPSAFHKRRSSETTSPEHSPHQVDFHPGSASGSSPFLPGSSQTSGRDHKQKSGKNIVRSWVQEQQFRTYQSSPSQVSLDSNQSSHHRSPSLKAHALQQPSPDFKTSPQGRQLHSSAEFKPGQLQSSPTNQRGFQASPASSRSSSSLPRNNNSSSSLQRQREAEKQRLRTLSLENKGVLQLAPQEFASKGGSRVMQQFNEAIQADEHLRSHNSYQFSQEHAQQRAHDQHTWNSHVTGGPGYHQTSHKQQQRSHDQWQRSHDQQQRSHDQWQRSHDHIPQSLQQHHKSQQRQEVIDSSDYPLPNSPAPPPYKSPSPDSEQAQKLQQLNSRQPQSRQPKPQFVYHAAALGMVEEQQFTSLDDDVSTARKTGQQPQHKLLQSQPVGRERFDDPRVLAQEPRQQASEGDVLPSRQQQQRHAQNHTHVSPNHTFHGQASAKPPTSKSIENHADQKGPQTSSSKDRPSTPDIIKELEDLMGGVEAMVTSPDFSAEDDTAADQTAKQTTEQRNEPHPGSHREEAAPADGDSQKVATKLTVQEVAKEDRLPSPLKSPPQSPQPQTGQELQTSTTIHSPRRIGDERNRGMPSPSSSQAVSPDQGEDIIDPPTPWRNNVESPPPSSGFPVPEENLAGILQEVMTTHNLPPPPAHLMALSQELEGHGQDPRGIDSPDGPSQRGVPSIATTSLSSPHHHAHKEAPPTGGGDGRAASTAPNTQGTKFDPKLFSRKKVEVPLAYENVRHGSANLPPEIANFMSRVRNASIDNSDGSIRSDGGKIASGKSPSRAPDVGSRQGVSVPKDEEKASEEVFVYDTLGKPGELKVEATDSGEQTREQPTSVVRSGEERGGLKNNPHSLGDEQTDSPQSPNEDSTWFEKAQASPVHPEPVLSSSQMPQSQAKATDLPRGQVSDFSQFSSHQQQHRSESMSSSHGSTHPARSDMVAPVHPKEGPSGNQSFWSKQPQLKQQQRNVTEAGGPLSKPPQDGRRAQTFSGTARPVLKSHAGPSHLHHRMITPVTSEDVDPDSLPNSPTYFAQVQQQENRETPSPGTQIENRSFQEYLNTLDAQSRMKKKKVVEWIQRSNIRQWEKDHQVKEEEGPPEKLRLDAGTNLPARPYQKQEPIYATADEPEPKTGVKLMEPNRARTEPDGGRMEWQHHRMEPDSRGRPPMELGRQNRSGSGWGSGMEPLSQVRDRTRTEPSSSWGTRYEREGYRMEPGSHDRPRMQSETGGRTRTEQNIHNRPRMEAGGHNRNWNTGYGAQKKTHSPFEWRNPQADPRYGMDNRTRLATVSSSNPASSQFRYPPSAQQIPRSQASAAGRGNQGSASSRHQSIDPKAKFGDDYYVLDV